MKYTKKRMTICVTFLVLLLAFIWGNSLLPGDDSGTLSGLVGEILGTLFPFLDFSSEIGSFILRKIAHFSEFAALGMVLTWLFGMTQSRKWGAFLFPPLCGAAVACIDETIQVFSPDRHASLVDVSIDSAGVLTGTLVLVGLSTLYHIWNQKSRMH